MYEQSLKKIANAISRDYEGWSRRNDYLTPEKYRRHLKHLKQLYVKVVAAYKVAKKSAI